MHPIHHRRPLRAAALGLSALGLCAGAAAAEPAPPFAELLREAQQRAPRLAEALAEIARAEGLSQQAGTRPNPTLGLEVENFSGSGPFRGADLAETTATLEQTLELGGKRRARASAGRAEVEAARRRAVRIRGEYAFDLAVAYAEAEASDRRLRLATDSAALAEEDARVAGALVDAGREADLRRVQARGALQAARASIDEARAARATAFDNLTALAGAPAPITSVPVSLLDQRRPLFATANPAASGTAAYLAAEAERDAAARRLRVERTRAVPDLSVSVGLRRFQDDDATAFVAGLSAPLPLFDRNRGNISAARAEVAAAEARLNAARLDAEASARSSAARLTAAESRLASAQEGERTADEAYRLTRIGYEGGKLALIELLNARRALTDARTQTIAAAVESVSAQAALARLNGGALLGDQP
ncbi:TolC family protein [Phenylobacterium sp. LjRoot225]|uniref:TolC family protein n=1 Tax=Phenylobacterium sp. LjRoot225 TaxID=3342285 RepID=UPI003ECD4B17